MMRSCSADSPCCSTYRGSTHTLLKMPNSMGLHVLASTCRGPFRRRPWTVTAEARKCNVFQYWAFHPWSEGCRPASALQTPRPHEHHCGFRSRTNADSRISPKAMAALGAHLSGAKSPARPDLLEV